MYQNIHKIEIKPQYKLFELECRKVKRAFDIHDEGVYASRYIMLASTVNNT